MMVSQLINEELQTEVRRKETNYKSDTVLTQR